VTGKLKKDDGKRQSIKSKGRTGRGGAEVGAYGNVGQVNKNVMCEIDVYCKYLVGGRIYAMPRPRRFDHEQ